MGQDIFGPVITYLAPLQNKQPKLCIDQLFDNFKYTR